MKLWRSARAWSLCMLIAACGDDGGGSGAQACREGTKACGNGCIPANGVCCEISFAASSSSYCTNSAGGGCFPNDGRCSAAFPAGAQAEHCCSENGSIGSNDCPSGRHHCGLLCYPADRPCDDVAPEAGAGGESGAQAGAGGSAGAGAGGSAAAGAIGGDGACTQPGGCELAGDVTAGESSCTYQGIFGLDLNEFQVTLHGTATVPVGGGIILYTDPSTTMGASSGAEGPHSCGGWTASGSGDCTRGASDPETTSFTFSYNFASTSQSGTIAPSISAVDTNGYTLDSVALDVRCDAQAAPDGGSAGTGGGGCTSSSTPTGSTTCSSQLVCGTFSCMLSCDGTTCTCSSGGAAQRSFPQEGACATANGLSAAQNMCSCFP